MNQPLSSYGQDGVNVSLGDQFSSFAGQLCRQTYGNNPNIKVHDFSQGHFRGPKGFEPIGMPSGTILDLSPDGIGTKSVITDAAFFHRFSSRDWVAMCAGDITRWGGKAALLINDLSVSSLGDDKHSNAYLAACDLMIGLRETADECGYVMYKGETAELSSCVASENPNARLKYNWSGAALGFLNRKNLITGQHIKAGQSVMALRELGFRSNGGSSVRKAFARKFGPEWHKHPEAQKYIRLAAEPSVLYDEFLAHANGWSSPDLIPIIKMSLVVHLTGGSFEGKFFEDILQRHGFSAELYSLWSPPEIMGLCSLWRGLTAKESYQTFNGGQGVLVVIDDCDADEFIGLAQSFGIEAQKCGEITAVTDRPRLVIHSKFDGTDDHQVVFE